MSAWTVDRRDLLAQLLILVGAPVTAASLSACDVRRVAKAGAGKFFDADAMATLTDVIDLMIPHTDTPGAVDIGVPAFVDGLMADWAGPTARGQVSGVFADLDALARAQADAPYATLDRDGRLAALTALDTRSFEVKDKRADAYKLFKKLVFVGYATSEQMLRDHVPNPGPYFGDLNRAQYDKLIVEKSVGAQ